VLTAHSICNISAQKVIPTFKVRSKHILLQLSRTQARKSSSVLFRHSQSSGGFVKKQKPDTHPTHPPHSTVTANWTTSPSLKPGPHHIHSLSCPEPGRSRVAGAGSFPYVRRSCIPGEIHPCLPAHILGLLLSYTHSSGHCMRAWNPGVQQRPPHTLSLKADPTSSPADVPGPLQSGNQAPMNKKSKRESIPAVSSPRSLCWGPQWQTSYQLEREKKKLGFFCSKMQGRGRRRTHLGKMKTKNIVLELQT
jgi:hypothetical protein